MKKIGLADIINASDNMLLKYQKEITRVLKERNYGNSFRNMSTNDKITYMNDYLAKIDFPNAYRWNEERLKSKNFYGMTCYFIDNKIGTNNLDEILKIYFNDDTKKVYELIDNIYKASNNNITADSVEWYIYDNDDDSIYVKLFDNDKRIYYELELYKNKNDNIIYLGDILIDFDELFNIFLRSANSFRINTNLEEKLCTLGDRNDIHNIILETINDMLSRVSSDLNCISNVISK